MLDAFCDIAKGNGKFESRESYSTWLKYDQEHGTGMAVQLLRKHIQELLPIGRVNKEGLVNLTKLVQPIDKPRPPVWDVAEE